MAEYIEREALLRDISESVVVTVRHGKPSPELRGVSKVIDRIKSVPTADVAEVLHGKWLYVSGKGRYAEYECSECHKHVCFDEKIDGTIAPYEGCPHCLAKMDGKEN